MPIEDLRRYSNDELRKITKAAVEAEDDRGSHHVLIDTVADLIMKRTWSTLQPEGAIIAKTEKYVIDIPQGQIDLIEAVLKG